MFIARTVRDTDKGIITHTFYCQSYQTIESNNQGKKSVRLIGLQDSVKPEDASEMHFEFGKSNKCVCIMNSNGRVIDTIQ